MKRIILVDGNSLMYRAYYGTSNTNMMQNSNGLYTNAIYSFCKMINTLTMNKDYDGILVAFDKGKKTFRHELMDDYKAGRSSMPDELRMQIPYIKEFLDIKRIKRFEIDLYEADDIIGTIANKAKKEGYHVDIYSSDKDLLQLVSENVYVHLTKKGLTELEDFTVEYFKNKYEIDVFSFIDLKALMGDKSDNIPGIKGIGEVKAIKLLKEYKNLEGIFKNIDKISGKDKDKLLDGKDLAYLCRKMATILLDCPIDLEISDILRQESNVDIVNEFYKTLEFRSLIVKTEEKKEINVSYQVINDTNELKKLFNEYNHILIESSEYNYHKAFALCLCFSNENGNYIIEPDLFKDKSLKQYLEDENIKKSVYDYKRVYVSLKHFGINLKGVDFDLLLSTYLLNSKVLSDDFTQIVSFYKETDIPTSETVYGKGKNKRVPQLDILYKYVTLKTQQIKELYADVLYRLKENEDLYYLLTKLEIPLSYVLGKMEYNGVCLDLEELEHQRFTIAKEIQEVEREILSIANKNFNINSPKQLADVLFLDLNIKYPESTTKYSTDINILKQLVNEHIIIEKIIKYRQLSKLYSLYIIPLKEHLFLDNKIHTIYEQAFTQTGRLSSVSPNIQNIPIRTKEGSLIRKMFIPTSGNKLYSADYSQIELRVLASLANVKNFKEAFNNDIDIHELTAKKLFLKDEISKEERRKAKAVNFGIIYGISAFGLAQDLQVSLKEAKEFIEKYKAIYYEIEDYMNKTVEECSKNGFVKTILGRIRYIDGINSSNRIIKEQAKRYCMNTPIQGSAADIMKLAMVEIDKEFEKLNLKSKMIIQVHDELVFDCTLDELEIVRKIVKDKMENSFEFDVKLTVEDGFANNWQELK